MSVMTPAVRHLGPAKCHDPFSCGESTLFITMILFMYDLGTQRSTSFFGWLTGSILWVKTSKISVIAIGVLGKYLSPISVQEVSGAPPQTHSSLSGGILKKYTLDSTT